MKKGFVFLVPLIVLGLAVVILATSIAFWRNDLDPNQEKAPGAVSASLSSISEQGIIEGRVVKNVLATAYCPKNNKLEGGLNDERGISLRTLQNYLLRKPETNYVSVAMDVALRDQGYPYGTKLRIPELEAKYNNGRYIEFRLVDNGGCFNGTSDDCPDKQKKARGFTMIDIANSCEHMSNGWSNMQVTLIFEKKAKD